MRQQRNKDGKKLRDNLVQPSPFTDGETEAQNGDPLSKEPLQLLEGPVPGSQTHIHSAHRF